MNKAKELWVSWCHVTAKNAPAPKTEEVLIVALSEGESYFIEQVSRELNFLDYQVRFDCDILPSFMWQQQNSDPLLNELIARVNESHPLAFGPLPKYLTTKNEQIESFLTIEPISIKPLPANQSIWPEKHLPDEVAGLLFPADGLHTYAVINAQRIQFLDSLLENSTLAHQCLVKNATSFEAMSNSPWLVKLEATNKFTQCLFSHDPEDQALHCYWQKDALIYLRTAASLEQLSLHLGRFFRVRDEQDSEKFYFFYYFNPEIAASYFAHVQDWRERVIKWFCPSKGPKIEAMFVPQADNHCLQLTPNTELQAEGESIKAFTLTARDRAGFKSKAERKNIERMLQQLVVSLAALELSEETIRQELIQSIEKNKDYNIQDGEHLFMLALMAIGFENRTQWQQDARDYADEVLTTNESEALRVENYIERIQTMEQAS